MSDLKIYFIAPPLNDSFIKPWSVVGRYVRRCIIIYEKMPFDKLVSLCKQSALQFKELSVIISKNRLNFSSESVIKSMGSTNKDNDVPYNPSDSNYEIENSNSPVSGALFSLNDESYLTMTGDYLNRSANADCSGMDLDESAVSLSHINTSLNTSNNKDFLSRLYTQGIFNSKALTSTVSAQRTQALGNFKSSDKVETNTANSKPHKSKQPTSVVHQMISAVRIQNDSVSMPPPQVSAHFTLEPNSTIHNAFSLKNGCSFSRKIAEYFVAKQASLLENNEHDAMNPVELNSKIGNFI